MVPLSFNIYFLLDTAIKQLVAPLIVRFRFGFLKKEIRLCYACYYSFSVENERVIMENRTGGRLHLFPFVVLKKCVRNKNETQLFLYSNNLYGEESVEYTSPVMDCQMIPDREIIDEISVIKKMITSKV